MFVSSRGGSIRRLIGSAHRHVIAMRHDPQMRFGQPTEGIAEGPAMMRCATDPDISYYQFQPFRIELPVAGELASWICDVVYLTRDGSVHVREIKRSPADFAKLEYQAKLQAVSLTLSRLGWQFSTWTLDQIRGSNERQVNVANIYFDRAAHLDDLMPRFEEIWHAISYWTSRRHPTVSKVWKDVVADTNAYNLGKPLIMHNGIRQWEMPLPGEEIAPVDPEFFRQLVKQLESRTAYRHRYSAQAAQQRWEGGGQAAEPVRFLEIVQQDETEAPAFFFIDAINREPLGKATWVIAVCVYTRCVLAWDLSFDAPSKVSWMRNILNASKMKRLPKKWAEAFPALATIGGRMSTVVYDNPTHLIGQTVQDAHGDVVQDVLFAGEGQPTHKPLVERTHETLRSLFTDKFLGSKMPIALAREFNIDASKETLLTLQEARLAMSDAICTYHTTPLRGLNGRTPLDVWDEQWNRWGPQHAKDQEQFARAIGEVTFDRALNNNGIVHEHLEYSHREITPLLMEAYAAHSHHRRNTKKPTFDVKVKYDPTDMSRIFVFDPMAQKYRELPAKKRRYTEGLTLAMHKLVLRNHRAKSLMADPDAENRLLEIRREAEIELSKICPQMEAMEKRARAANMQQPIIRDMMGGDIHLIEVAPSPTGMEVQHDTGFNRADALEKPVRSKRGTRHNDAHAQPDDTDADDVSILLSAGPPDAELQDVSSNLPRERADTDVAHIDDDDDDIIGTFDDY